MPFAQLKALLNRPARPGDPCQLRQGRPRRPAAREVRHLGRVRHAPPDQQPPAVHPRVRGVRPADRPIVQPWPLRPIATTEPMPAARRHLRQQRLRPDLSEAGPDGVVGPHAHDVAQPQPLQGRAEAVIRPVHRVGRHPLRRHPGGHRPRDHPPGQQDLGREPHRPRHAGLPPPAGVLGPLLGQVQRPVQQRPPARGCVTQEDADLAVLDAAGGAGILAGYTDRLAPLLQKPGLVHDQHAFGVPEALADVAEQLVADRVGVPVGPRQQVLHAVGGRVAEVLGQLPAVLPLRVAQQPADVADGALAGLAAGEVPADALGHPRQLVRPPRNSNRRRPSCHRTPSP